MGRIGELQMLESKMYKNLKNKIIPLTSLTRIENRSGGIPDIYFCNKYKSGWIELKEIKHIRKDRTFKIPFRIGQLSWIKWHQRRNII